MGPIVDASSNGRISPSKAHHQLAPLTISIGNTNNNPPYKLLAGREQRQKIFGLDCIDSVTFEQWQPGQEYVKALTVKNVGMGQLKIIFSPPKGTSFSIDQPKMATLSTGTTLSIPIRFSPAKHERYHDTVEFMTACGTFIVDLIGALPQHKLVFVERIDFGYCPIRETTTKSIQVTNNGPLPSYFIWNTNEDSPFRILSSETGILHPGESMNVGIGFCPEDASVFDACIVCCFGDRDKWDCSRKTKLLKVRGVGKYSYVRVRHDVKTIAFGDALAGSVLEKLVMLDNLSTVPANFTIHLTHSQSSIMSAFSVLPTQGCIGPRSSVKIRMVFSPKIILQKCAETVNVQIASGTGLQLTCTGQSIASKVSLGTNVINFGDVPTNHTVSKCLALKNSSAGHVSFQFTLDGTGVFKVDRACGVLEPHQSIIVTVRFLANDSFSYYRRVYCLLTSHDALVLDLLATSYNETIKPPLSITPTHLEAFQKRLHNGLWMYHPDELKDMLQQEVIQYKDNYLSYIEVPRDLDLGLRSDAPCEGSEILSEYYNETLMGVKLANISESVVNFGSSLAKGFMPQKVVRLSNNTKGNVTGLWTIPSNGSFNVEPRRFDVKSQDVTDFRILFSPGSTPNELYSAELECFLSFAATKLLDEKTVTPSWCTKVAVTGNTFDGNAPAGQVNFSQTRIQFPGTHVERSVFTTVDISNPTAQAIIFSMEDISGAPATSALGPVLSIKPRQCVLNPEGRRLLVARFVPADPIPYSTQLISVVNDRPISGQTLTLDGSGHFAKLSLSTGSCLTFRPVLLGTTATQDIVLKNESQIVVDYKWPLPETAIAIEPSSGQIVPNECRTLKCSFTPSAVANFDITLSCRFGHSLSERPPWPDHPQNYVNTLALNIKGTGAIGKIISDPMLIDFGPVLINKVAEQEVRIFNPTECEVMFGLHVVKVGGSGDDCEFHIETYTSVLYSRAYSSIRIRVIPKKSVESRFRVLYQVKGIGNRHDAAKMLKLTDVVISGVLPLAQIMDIRSYDLSKSALWRMFNVDKFNQSIEKGEPDVHEESVGLVHFDFGASFHESSPSIVYIRLRNTGIVPVHWSFSLPSHTDVQPESWVNVADQTEEEAQQTFVVEHGLFDISPNNGTLVPSEETIIEFVYNHREVGTHSLPCVFRLSNGNASAGHELLAVVIGHTVSPVQKYAHVPSAAYEFQPVAVNAMRPPVQTFEIPNHGLVSWKYKIDQSVFDKIKHDHYGFEVLSCLQLSGSVNPGESARIPFIFRPAEAKHYIFGISIQFDDGSTRVVTVSGHGIAQYSQGDNFKRHKRTDHGDPIPSTRSIELQHQLAAISVDRLNFGHVPLGAILKQIVVIQSQPSQRMSLRFNWEIPSCSGLECLVISPANGILNPGGSVICKLVMTVDQQPRILDTDLVCLLFSDQDSKASTDGATTSLHDKVPFVGSRDYGVRSSRVDLRTIKYRPLPPISNSIADLNEPDDDARLPASTSTPICRLYVGLAFHSHCAEEFNSLYSGFEKCFFGPISSPPSRLPCLPSSSTYAVFKHMIDGMLDDIMQELDSERLVKSLVSDDDLPFFAQVATAASNGVYAVAEEEQGDETDDDVDHVERVLRSTKFQGLTEKVFENTIYNLLLEFNAGEFDATACI
ncbi:hypothetical protein SeLEV6574_g05387 [Synchytrium endobioticum]|uniref:Abnormal spindle-like microcephaly-associated protein ASH domain-containing protein n=1 Tax=Synchytrium endobioticum TaxID=286115 RepID=A0A507CUW1_9FUNG|nr:hypothetical protein SeLEV6574_g05387 [Synchytrium endobioticum]